MLVLASGLRFSKLILRLRVVLLRPGVGVGRGGEVWVLSCLGCRVLFRMLILRLVCILLHPGPQGGRLDVEPSFGCKWSGGEDVE